MPTACSSFQSTYFRNTTFIHGGGKKSQHIYMFEECNNYATLKTRDTTACWFIMLDFSVHFSESLMHVNILKEAQNTIQPQAGQVI